MTGFGVKEKAALMSTFPFFTPTTNVCANQEVFDIRNVSHDRQGLSAAFAELHLRDFEGYILPKMKCRSLSTNSLMEKTLFALSKPVHPLQTGCVLMLIAATVKISA